MKSLIRKAAVEPAEGTPSKVAPEDETLKELIEEVKAKIMIMGVGGAGSNTVTRLNALGIEDVVTVAANTDGQHLLESVADRKILLGRELCGGNGAGGDPKIGQEAAKESENELRELLEGTDILFLMAGLGGGTGTGGAPVIANLAREMGAVVVSIVTLPFSAEGRRKKEIAESGLEELSNSSDTIVVINNDRILEVASDLPLHQAFLVSDEVMARAVKGIVELVTKPGLINVDLADLRSVLERGGPAIIAFGESDGENRATEAVEDALGNPLLEADISGGTAAVVNISCGSDFSLHEMEQVVETVVGVLEPDANVIWGARIDEDLRGTVQVLLVITGVSSPYLPGIERAPKAAPAVETAKPIAIERSVRPTLRRRERGAARSPSGEDILGELGIAGL